MSLFTLGGTAVQLLLSYVADAKIKETDFQGPYRFNGKTFDQFVRVKNPQGFVDEYTNKEEFCVSWVYHTGLSLMPDAVLGVMHLIFLFWLFIGIAILADIFMESIEVITSKSKLVQIPNADGELI